MWAASLFSAVQMVCCVGLEAAGCVCSCAAYLAHWLMPALSGHICMSPRAWRAAEVHVAGGHPPAGSSFWSEELRSGAGLGTGGPGIGSPRGGGSGAIPSPPRRDARERELIAAYGQLNDATETLNERAVAVMKRMSDKLTGRDFSQVRLPLQAWAAVQQVGILHALLPHAQVEIWSSPAHGT